MKNLVKQIVLISAVTFIFQISTATAAIQFNGDTLQSNQAATNTGQVNDLINEVVTGQLGATSTSDVDGMVQGGKNAFGRLNDWLLNTAGINLKGIFGAIGHFLVLAAGFVFDLIKGLLWQNNG